MLRTLLVISLLINFSLSSRSQTDSMAIADLRAAILEKMDHHNVPAVSIAIVRKDGPVWIDAMGMANKENDIRADENTQFRIGSVSKMFVALSILKLQEQGLLSIHDKVKDLVPEIEFENPWEDTNPTWEDTNPIRIIHLLEHTTGWDDFHLIEYASNDPKPLTLKEGLDYHPHSRKSRWIPGSRMAYCNSGPPVAAYIIEKVTGLRFEDYVEKHFFEPLKMQHTTYFKSNYYNEHGATLYEGNKPRDYWHILMRPSGSINSSAKEMALFIQFLLNAGLSDSLQLVSSKSIRQMEVPTSTPAAKAGMKMGYGMHNYTSAHNGYIFHGHNGGVNGGLTDLGYLPDEGIGHIVMINSGDGRALFQLTKLVKDFEINNLVAPEPALADTSSIVLNEVSKLNGYYVPINPRTQMAYFFMRLVGVKKMTSYKDGSVRIKNYFGKFGPKMLTQSSSTFIDAQSGEIDLISGEDPLAGPVLYHGMMVLKPISKLLVHGQIIFIIIWFLLMIILVFSKMGMKTATSVASIVFFAFVVMLMIGAKNVFEYLSEPGFFSITLMLLSIAYALAVLWSIWKTFKTYSTTSGPHYWVFVVLAFCHFVVLIYLAWFGVIGVRTWI